MLVVPMLAASMLAACAPEPVRNWSLPTPAPIEGVTLASASGASSPSAPSSEPVDETAGIAPASWADADLGLVGGRLRNDALPFAARFVYVPGVAAFNDRVNALLWQAIEATGVWYGPQAHEPGAGLAERGCVADSGSWPAAEVLSRPETGPAGGSGTAVTCEIDGAFGTILLITLRVVTGSADGVTGDTVHRLVVDVARGTVGDLGERWRPEALKEFFVRTVELLRQNAGGLSSAPIAEPSDEQLLLVQRALDTAIPAENGGIEVQVPAGLASPELEGLRVNLDDEPYAVHVDGETVHEWSSEQQTALLDAMRSGDGGAAAPFVGAPGSPTSVPIDCALIPCIALTYDDGPSAFTAELLDTLRSAHALATFYMLGGSAQANPDPVIRAAAEGHELGSHTMSHPDLTTVSLGDARAQVIGAADVLRGLTGQAVATFRPPYGAVNQSVIAAVGMPAVLWSVDTQDWQDPGRDALIERAVGGATPGGIVLFHDTHAGSVAVAGDIITALRDRGFEPVTVSTLFGGTVPNGLVRAR